MAKVERLAAKLSHYSWQKTVMEVKFLNCIGVNFALNSTSRQEVRLGAIFMPRVIRFKLDARSDRVLLNRNMENLTQLIISEGVRFGRDANFPKLRYLQYMNCDDPTDIINIPKFCNYAKTGVNLE